LEFWNLYHSAVLRPCLAACVVLFQAAAARAEPLSHVAVRLEYMRGPGVAGCPNHNILRHLLASQLGYDPVLPDAKDLLIVSVSRKGRMLHAELSATGVGGQVFWRGAADSGKDCTDLLTTAALVIRIGIAPFPAPSAPLQIESPPADPPPAPSRAPAGDRPALVPAPAVTSSPPLPVASSRPRYLFAASSFLALNRAPFPTLGLGVTGAARWSSISVVVDGSALVPFSVEVHDDRGETALVYPTLIATSFGPCGHVDPVFLCALVELGTREFSGSPNIRIDVDDPFSAGFVLRGGAQWFFTDHFALRGSLDLAALLTQTRLTVEKRDFWQSPAIAAALSGGIAASF
jgi:hypothetical protein